MSPFELIRAETADEVPSNEGTSVKRMCRLLEVSRSGYYDYLNRQAAPPPEREERLIAMIRAIHAECEGAYGVRRMHRELLAAGERVSRKRVRRLMRENGIRSVHTPKFIKTTDSNHDLGYAPNLLNQQFGVDAPDRAWVGDIERHEALANPAVVKGHRILPVAAGRSEAEGSLNRGTPVRAEAALTTTGRASTVRWSKPGKRDRKAYVRNQRQKAPQETHQLEPDGLGLGSSAHLWDHAVRQGTPQPGDVDGLEATAKNCGVAVAMLQGHSWTPTLSRGSRVNVGTIPSVPSPTCILQFGGKARCRPMPTGWDGEPVVVRVRESRSHGEGVQRDRGISVDQGGRW